MRDARGGKLLDDQLRLEPVKNALPRRLSPGEGLVLTVLHVCQESATSDRSCLFDQLPRFPELRNACVVFGSLVSHSLLQISLGLSGGFCQLFLDQFDLSVSFALNFLDSLEQQVSSVFVPLTGGIDFDLKLCLGFTNGLFIFGFESFDFRLVSSNLALDLKIRWLGKEELFRWPLYLAALFLVTELLLAARRGPLP